MVRQIRILLADDHDLVRQAITELLKDEPTLAVAAEASNYAELLKMLRDMTPEIILMDVHMKGIGSFDVATIRDQLRGPCLLAMSFANNEETVKLAQSFGALKVLDKVELASTLIPAIQECIQDKMKASHA